MPKPTRDVINMEMELAAVINKHYGRDLVAALVDGSYAYYEHVPGVSDYDAQVFVRHFSPMRPTPEVKWIGEKYRVEISLSVKDHEDLKNRIKDNNKATRFVSNLNLIDFKLKTRLLTGADIRQVIPPMRRLIKRDTGTELRELYLKMTNGHPAWNLSQKGPGEWSHSMINLAYALALSKGAAPKKKDLVRSLRRLYPDLPGVANVQKALALRKTGKIRRLSEKEKRSFRRQYDEFLDAYRNYVFF